MTRYINTCSNGPEAIALGGRRLHEEPKGTSLERRVVDSMVPKQIDDKGISITHVSNQCDSLADLCIVGRLAVGSLALTCRCVSAHHLFLEYL